MCTEAAEMTQNRRDEREETFEDFKRIILDGMMNCEDDPDDL
jgi:hypothetical protein